MYNLCVLVFCIFSRFEAKKSAVSRFVVVLINQLITANGCDVEFIDLSWYSDMVILFWIFVLKLHDALSQNT